MKELIADNQIHLPLSINETSFLLYSRSLQKGIKPPPSRIIWQAIGEIGDFEKPLWLNYLQNSADLVRHGEEVAAVVMLLISLEFYYDHLLDRLDISYETIRRVGRRSGMNEKKRNCR